MPTPERRATALDIKGIERGGNWHWRVVVERLMSFFRGDPCARVVIG